MNTKLDVVLATEVTKTVNKKRVPVGKVDVYMPSVEMLQEALQELAPIVPKRKDDEGLPVYDNNLLDWLARTVRGAVLVQARNKLQSGTAELKPGAKIADTLAALIEPPAAGGNGAAFKELAELRASFNTYIDSLGKKEKTAGLIKAAFKDAKAFSLQPIELREKLIQYFVDYAEAVGEDALSVVQLAHIERLCTVEEDEEDEDFSDL